MLISCKLMHRFFGSVGFSLLNQGVKSDHERQREQHAAGGGASGFDSGRTWGSSIPKVGRAVEAGVSQSTILSVVNSISIL